MKYEFLTKILPQSKRYLQRNKRKNTQWKEVSAAALIFVSGGMNIAWSLQLWTLDSLTFTNHFRISWFLGAIIGALISNFIVKIVPKKLITQIAAVLVIIDGITLLFVASSNEIAFIIARYMDGIANGLSFAMTLALIGEIVDKSIRGRIAASIEPLCISFGILQHMWYTPIWTYELNSQFTAAQIQGALALLYGIISFFMATYCIILQSPVELLLKGQEAQAIDVLRRLNQSNLVNTEIYTQLEEHKCYLLKNRQLSCGQSKTEGIISLLHLCLYRALNAMSFSMFISFALTYCSVQNFQLNVWPIQLCGVLRLMGSLMTSLQIDSLGRKIPTFFALLCCGSMAFAFAPVLNVNEFYGGTLFIAPLLFIFIQQFFAGMAAPASAAYLTEAFPLPVKHFYINASFIVEMFVQIIIICYCELGVESTIIYFHILGGYTFGFFVLGILLLPETKDLTLREAQIKFRRNCLKIQSGNILKV